MTAFSESGQSGWVINAASISVAQYLIDPTCEKIQIVFTQPGPKVDMPRRQCPPASASKLLTFGLLLIHHSDKTELAETPERIPQGYRTAESFTVRVISHRGEFTANQIVLAIPRTKYITEK